MKSKLLSGENKSIMPKLLEVMYKLSLVMDLMFRDSKQKLTMMKRHKLSEWSRLKLLVLNFGQEF